MFMSIPSPQARNPILSHILPHSPKLSELISSLPWAALGLLQLSPSNQEFYKGLQGQAKPSDFFYLSPGRI